MPVWTQLPKSPLDVGVLLFDAFSNLCLANCVEPLRAANSLLARPAYHWRFVTPQGRPVRSSSGMQLTPDCALEDAGRLDVLLVLASYGHIALDTRQTRAALRRGAAAAAQVAGFDSAPWLMASAGLLEGRRATLHSELRSSFAERFLGTELVHAPVVEDGPFVTCVGAAAAYGLARSWVVRDLGQSAGLDIDLLFQRGVVSGQTGGQTVGLTGGQFGEQSGREAGGPLGARSGPHSVGASGRQSGRSPDLWSGPRDSHGAAPGLGDPFVSRVIALMEAHVETPLPLAGLAARLGQSPRTMSRRCHAVLGVSPGRLYTHLRLSAARQMLETGLLPVSEIALRTGYEDAAAFARAYRRRFGAAPTAARRGRPDGDSLA